MSSGEGYRIFLGHLPRDCTKEDVRDLLSEFRGIREVTVKDGYGFAEFDSHSDANDCVKYYHNKNFMGERIVVEFAKPQRRYRENSSRPKVGWSILIENCPDMSWQELKDHFRSYGQVLYTDYDSIRREAVVEFITRDDMDRCIRKCDGTKLKDEIIRMKPHHRRNARSRSPSPGRGGNTRYERYDRDRSSRNDRYDRSNRYDRGERDRSLTRSSRYDRNERTDRGDRNDRFERSERSDRYDRHDRSDREPFRRGRSLSRSRSPPSRRMDRDYDEKGSSARDEDRNRRTPSPDSPRDR